jgi:hypothetical protein
MKRFPNMRLPIALVLCLGASLFIASRLEAATVWRLSLEELVAKADLIVVATVSEQTSRWNKYGRIVTDVTLAVDQPIKGDTSNGEQLVVTTLGGTIGELLMKVEGSARFVSGSSVLVFLRQVPGTGELRPVGMSQGVRYLSKGSYGQLVLSNDQGLALVEQNESGTLTITAARNDSSASDSADQLISEIRRIVAELAIPLP